nr:PREDICTED: uncharacterized protein LOC105670016 isoform X2 [Linepithema humile]
MMYTLKGRYAVVTILLFALSRGDLFRRTRQQQRYNPGISAFPWHLAPSWEYILHEIILKSVTPPPQDANVPYKRPLDASFYGGPVNVNFSDDVNVVSRGNVYRLLNGHWMLCQDGCVDCEPCAAQRNPLFKWVLQRVKQLSVSDSPRHDLQLTIMPQADDRFPASNLWPNSYVYVTSQSERAPVSIIRTQYNNNHDNVLSNLENSFSEQHYRSKDLWRLTPRDSVASQDKIPRTDDRVTIQENASTEQPKKEESPEQRDRFRNTTIHRSRPKFVKEQDQSINLTSKLILGTDQQGQKHLIHVVPVDHPPTIALPVNHSQFANDQAAQLNDTLDQATQSNDTIPKREKQAYQWILRRIFDSLNTHRQSIENFLESSPADNAQRIPSSTDNMEAVASSWRNRNARHMNARNVEPLRFNNATLPSLYVGNEDGMGRHRYRNKYGYENMKQNVNNYYTTYRDTNQDIMLRGQSLIDSNWNRIGDRRKIHTKPYFVNGKNISRIDSLIPFKNSG